MEWYDYNDVDDISYLHSKYSIKWTLYISSHLISTAILCWQDMSYYPHFIVEKMEFRQTEKIMEYK